MEMALTSRSDYAVRAMICVARLGEGERRKAAQISATMQIPGKYIAQILAPLVAAGLLQSVAGPRGGYTLARPAGEISLLEIIEVAEGPIHADRCVLRGGPCDWEETCPLHVTWSRARTAFTGALAQAVLADIAATDRAIEAGTFRLPADTPPHTIPTARAGRRD